MDEVIYVKFDFENQYPRQQFFKEVNRDNYYGRDHFLLWHTVLLENKSFILEVVVPKKVKFVICNERNEQIFTSSNHERDTLFPLLRYRAIAEWEKISDNYNVVLENMFSLRWKSQSESNQSFQEQVEDKEILKTFSYCGKDMEIYRIYKKHTICNAVWYEYYSGNEFVGIEWLIGGTNTV